MEKLEELRDKIGVSKSEFARMMGISVRTYYRWLEGGVTIERLEEAMGSLSSSYGSKVGFSVSIGVVMKFTVP